MRIKRVAIQKFNRRHFWGTKEEARSKRARGLPIFEVSFTVGSRVNATDVSASSVFVSGKPDAEAKMPVIVYIHGGG